MTPHPPLLTLEGAAAARTFGEAIAAKAWDRADQLLADLNGPQTHPTVELQAILHMHRERWIEAAGAWAILAPNNDQAAMRLLLCRNLASLRTHRPTVYRAIVDADVAEAYRIHKLPNGQTTIAAIDDTGAPILMSRDPAADVRSAMTQLQPTFNQGHAIAVLSAGDGHVLKAIAAHSQSLALGMQAPIFLIEPDPRLLLASLLMHDYTGPAGPIEQERVLWYAGLQWFDAFRIDAMTDRYLSFPQINVKTGRSSAGIERSLIRVITELQKLDAKAERDINAYYGGMTADHFAQAMTKQSGRPPRVLLLTTLFSTVLQFSTRDVAEAFRSLGWQAMIVIEPSPHHRLTRSAIRRSVAEFKPDLVFQIDHNRFEHGDLFPLALPFVNWIQDLLPNLMTPNAGRQIGATDFVLAPSMQRWVDSFNYPASQCMEFRKLTRVPSRPISLSDDSKVIYVSNWSQQPAQISEEMIRGGTGNAREVTAAACEQMIRIYAAGRSLPTPGDVRRVLLDVMRDLEVAADESVIRQTTGRLFDRMNNLLYRQQGLRWAAAACDELGLHLQIYGSGWEKHPEFAPYARGSIEYGAPLEALTRSAGVNLVLEPFVCVSHQRLLDALVAGGFCLLRDLPSNAILQSLIDIVHRMGGDHYTEASLRKALTDPADIELFEHTMKACLAIEAEPGFDHIANTRRQIDSGFIPPSGVLLPHLDQVLFANSDQMRQRLMRFSRDGLLRSEIAKLQRTAVEKRYSYAAGMKRMTDFAVWRLRAGQIALDRAA